MASIDLVSVEQYSSDSALPIELYRALTAFDDRLVEALAAKIIRHLSTVWLFAQPSGFKMPYRQQLEELERQGASPSPLLSPMEAVKLIRRGNRGIGAVTHGWLSPGNPDPAGARMKVLKEALKERPHIVAIFFEYA